MKKLIIAVVFVLGFIATGSAQSEKMQEQASEKVEELNQQIVAGGGEALSAEQREKITSLEIERKKKIRKVKKSGVEDDELKDARKEINKEINMMINKDILTKEQRKARKDGKEDMEDDN